VEWWVGGSWDWCTRVYILFTSESHDFICIYLLIINKVGWFDWEGQNCFNALNLLNNLYCGKKLCLYNCWCIFG
jgi:hypothetical protein